MCTERHRCAARAQRRRAAARSARPASLLHAQSESFGVIVFGEQHLLRDYVAYYNADRVHTQLGDSPRGRPMESRPSPEAQVVGLPGVGGLHDRYVWREAA